MAALDARRAPRTNRRAPQHGSLTRRWPPPSPWLPPQALRTVAQYQQTTAVLALLQPAPETLELFDDVMVLSSGKVGLRE